MTTHQSTNKAGIYQLAVLFLAFTLSIQFGKTVLIKFNLQTSAPVLYVANTFWLLLSLLSFSMQQKALGNNNPNVFVRAVMGSMLLKMMAGAMAVLIYYLAAPESFNQNAVIVFLLMYVLYLAVEVRIVMKLNNKKHG